MRVEPLPIDGLVLFRPAIFHDSRGWFTELWSQAKLAEHGLETAFAQDNLSYSEKPGTLRGLHFQTPPRAQGKLISVLTGSIQDVAVDIREGSPSYGEHVRVEMTAEGGEQLWIPPGFLHGFVTLTAGTRVLYKATAPYSREHDRTIAWNDPDLAVDWAVKDPILSRKDREAPRLRDIAVPFAKGWETA